MKRYRKMWFGAIMVALLIVLWGFFVAIPSETLAQKPEHVPMGIIGDFTGPYAPVIGPYVPGVEDGIKYVNGTLGGINGVKIKLHTRDMQGKVALGMQQYAELITIKPKPLFLGLMHSTLAEALKEKMVVDGMIGVGTGSVRQYYPLANSYGVFALNAEGVAIVVKKVRDDWKENRKLRLGIITWDSAYGRSFLTDEFFDYCNKIGVEIVGTEFFNVGDVDVTTQMVRLRAKKPDYLANNTLGSGPISILKAAKELGWKIPLLIGFGFEWSALRLAPELCEGILCMNNFQSFDEPDHPGIKALLEQMKENKRGEKEICAPYIFGYQTVLTMHKAVKDAVDRVGWNKLDIDSVKYAMNHLYFEPLDGAMRIEYTEKIRTNPWCVIFRVQGGKLINITPGRGFIKAPDLRPAQFR